MAVIRQPINNGASMALATSGNYRNSVVFDGKHYSHTIDPTTGEPIVGGAVGGEAIVEFGGLAAQHRFFVGAFDALFDDGGVVGQIEKARAAVRHAAKNQMLQVRMQLRIA